MLPRNGIRNAGHFESFVHMFLNDSSGSQNMGSADGSQTKVQSVSLHEDFKSGGRGCVAELCQKRCSYTFVNRYMFVRPQEREALISAHLGLACGFCFRALYFGSS